jgi:hypothetical protein
MNEDVAFDLLADQEAEAARGVEPFDPALDMDAVRPGKPLRRSGFPP